MTKDLKRRLLLALKSKKAIEEMEILLASPAQFSAHLMKMWSFALGSKGAAKELEQAVMAGSGIPKGTKHNLWMRMVSALTSKKATEELSGLI